MEQRTSNAIGRRAVLAGIAAGATAAMTATAAVAKDRPVADMELLVIAAQIDPSRPEGSESLTDKTKLSVLLLQDYLATGPYLSEDKVNGFYGLQTANAYFNYQRGLLNDRNYATGVPDPKTIVQIAKEGEFEIDNIPALGSKSDSYNGARVNTRTKKMLTEAAAALRLPAFQIIYGSYDARVSCPERTNQLGGSVDIAIDNLDTEQQWSSIRELRRVGFAAWLRPDEYIHAVAIGDYHLNPDYGTQQVADYYLGLDGLPEKGPDNTPEEYRVPFTWWEEFRRQN